MSGARKIYKHVWVASHEQSVSGWNPPFVSVYSYSPCRRSSVYLPPPALRQWFVLSSQLGNHGWTVLSCWLCWLYHQHILPVLLFEHAGITSLFLSSNFLNISANKDYRYITTYHFVKFQKCVNLHSFRPRAQIYTHSPCVTLGLLQVLWIPFTVQKSIWRWIEHNV